MEYEQQMVELGVALSHLAVRGTVSAVNKKLRAAKNIKDIETLRNTYDEILNEVLSEREEAVNIAQAYKAELDRIEISDEDIEHLHNTVSQALEILNGMSEEKLPVEEITQLKELISVDALKTMQLLGFNYKAAIGEPLTDICAQKIKQWGGVKTNQSNRKKNK